MTPASCSPGGLAALYDHPAVRALARAGRARGVRVWVAGGPVRDALLGRLGSDLDLLTDAPRNEVRDLLRAAGGVGQVAGALGTVSGWFPLSEASTCAVDVSPIRAPTAAQREAGNSAWGAVEWDLALRDLTVNSLALDAVTGQLLDPCGGRGDVVEGTLRTPLAPDVTFGMDPVRMLRAARFAVTLPGQLSPEVRSYLREHVPDLPAELNQRIFNELAKVDKHGPGAVVAFLLLSRELGFLRRVVAVDDDARVEGLCADGDLSLDAILATLSQGMPDRLRSLRGRGVPRARAHQITLLAPRVHP